MELLKVVGRDVLNESNQKVMLKGTCVGGWMNMENFINAFPGVESSLRMHMKKIIGEERANMFFDEQINNFLSEDDIKFIESTGANCVRLALNYRHFENDNNPFVYLEKGFQTLDKVIDFCEKYNIYVILDMHAVQGWQNAHWHSDNERGISLFWRDAHYQERFYALWQEFARRYKDRNVVAGYEIMNEPISSTQFGDYPYNFYENFEADWEVFNRVNQTAVEKIREIDKRHIIFIEGDNYGRKFDGMKLVNDNNIVYSAHNYLTSGFGPGEYPGYFKKLKNDNIEEAAFWNFEYLYEHIKNSEYWQFAEKYQVPMWVGEFGSQYCTGEEDNLYRLRSMDDQLRIYDELGIHWTTWTFKDSGVMGWTVLDPESEYMKLVEPVQKIKSLLGAENFTAWRGDSPGKNIAKDLACYINSLLTNTAYDEETQILCVKSVAITGYAANIIQPEYVSLFKSLSAEDIKRVMESFAFNKCIVNQKFIEVLKKHLAN